MKKWLFLGLLIVDNMAYGAGFAPNSTYVHFSDINLSEHKVYNAYKPEELLREGISFYTTYFLDSHEGNGALHLGMSGVDFFGKPVCAWNETRTELRQCPDDLPFAVVLQPNGKISFYLRVEEIRKVPYQESSKITFKNACLNQDGHYITSYRKKELFLFDRLDNCREIKTDSNGRVINTDD